MNRFVQILIGVVLCSLTAASAVVLNVPRYEQETGFWCWDASCEGIIHYFGQTIGGTVGDTTVTQQQIADYAVGGSMYLGNWLTGNDPANGYYHGCDDVLANWGVSSAYIGRPLTTTEIQGVLGTGNPIDIEWDWDTVGGGHNVVICGLEDSLVTVNDPFYHGGGVLVEDTSWVYHGLSWPGGTSGSFTHTWTQSLWTTVRPSPVTETIQVTAPTAGANVPYSDSLVICWNTNILGDIVVELLDASDNVYDIAYGYPAFTGRFALDFDANFLPPGSYRAVIRTEEGAANPVGDTGAAFNVGGSTSNRIMAGARPEHLGIGDFSRTGFTLAIPRSGNYAISAYRLDGRRVFTQRLSHDAGYVHLDSYSLPAGCYLFSVEGDGCRMQTKGFIR